MKATGLGRFAVDVEPRLPYGAGVTGADAPAEPAAPSPASAMTRRAPSGHRHRPLVPSRWRIPLLLATAAVLATVGVLVARGDGQPTVVMRGGMVEIQFTTDDQMAQRALARRCGLADATQMTPLHVRYGFPASQKNDVLACVDGSSIVRAVGLPG